MAYKPAHAPCVVCHQPYRAVRSNQTHCRPCRLLKNLEFWGEHSTKPDKCKVCKSKFRRVERADTVCGKCETSPCRGTCLVCDAENVEIQRHGAPICLVCLKSAAPGARTAVIQALRVAQRTHRVVEQGYNAAKIHEQTMNKAKWASDQLGISVDEAIRRAKLHLGLDPDKGTDEFAALKVALDQITHYRPAI